MRYDESEIIHYVIFGKKEELLQIPVGYPNVIVADETGKTELRPVYLFWDCADEKAIRLYHKLKETDAKGPGRLVCDVLSSVAVKHIQNKYKEVFLCQPETLFLSEKAEKEIPEEFWRMAPGAFRKLQEKYAKRETIKVLAERKERVALFCVIPEVFDEEELLDWLLEAESTAGVYLSDLFLLGEVEQKERAEDVLDVFYEETGMAGSFYPAKECKKLLMLTDAQTLLLDCLGLTVQQIGRPSFYIDGTGVRTMREMHRMEGVCEACRSLRMYLDRAFLSAL